MEEWGFFTTEKELLCQLLLQRVRHYWITRLQRLQLLPRLRALARVVWRRLQPRDGRMAHTIATRDIHQRLARLAPCQSLLPLMRSELVRAAKATLARPTFLWYQGFRCRVNP